MRSPDSDFPLTGLLWVNNLLTVSAAFCGQHWQTIIYDIRWCEVAPAEDVVIEDVPAEDVVIEDAPHDTRPRVRADLWGPGSLTSGRA